MTQQEWRISDSIRSQLGLSCMRDVAKFFEDPHADVVERRTENAKKQADLLGQTQPSPFLAQMNEMMREMQDINLASMEQSQISTTRTLFHLGACFHMF